MRLKDPILAALLAPALLTPIASAQAPTQNPVYLDDAPLATQALGLVPALVESDNHAEAIRVLQRLLDESGDRLIPSAEDGDLYTSVRSRVHGLLLADLELLARYRQVQGPAARTLLEAGEHRRVERACLLTSAGHEAALRVGQRLMERGDFEGARLVVEQLREHPDRVEGADGAGDLLAEIARYLDRDELWRELGAWGIEEALTPVEPPAIVVELKETPMTGAGPIDLDEMVASPLHSADLPGLAGPTDDGGINFDAFSPWAMPLLTADELIVNDGGAIASWDRFTFEQRWITRPEGYDVMDRIPGYRGRRGRSEIQMQDVSAVDVRGDLVAAITGWVVTHGRGGVAQRHGDPRLHVLDRSNGEVLWSWWPVLDDVEMSQAILVGRPVFEGELVLVQARKQIAARRSLGTYIYALRSRSGELVWSRLVGSSGSLPYQSQAGLVSPDLLVHEGVAYISSEIGVIGAIEAWSGRFEWARVRSGATFGGFDPAPAHALSPPVIVGENLFAITADRSEVLQLNARDGEVLAARNARHLGSPRYLVSADGMIAAVGDEQITVTPADAFATASARLIVYPPGSAPAGRVLGAGDRLLAPVEGGLMEVGARDPDRKRVIELRASGMTTPMAGQLVVTDASAVHGYLVWSTAERVLSERMDADPDDPAPAMTFAQLSVQAGRPERLVEALDRAMAAVGRMDGGELATAYRDRLFTMTLSMVRESAFEASMVDDLVALLDAAARTPRQRVAQLIELGAQHERAGRAREAIEAYQRILLDDDLAGATWPGPRLTVRADLEAARRLRGVLAAHGRELYARYEALAQSELRSLGDGAGAARLEAFARRYPASRASTEAWLRAADRYESRGEGHQAVRALRLGLQAHEAEGLVSTELPGRLLSALVDQGRWSEVARALQTLEPGAVPTHHGAPIDLGTIRRRVESELGERLRRPALGVPSAEGLVFVESWRLSPPVLASDWTDAGYAPVEQRREDRVRLGALRADATVAWEREFGAGARVLRADPDAMVVVEGLEGELRVEMVDAATGQTTWRSDPLDLDRQAGQTAFQTPMEGPVRADELLAVADSHTLVLCTRAGDAAGIDLAAGARLWSAELPIRRVHDAAIGAGIVAIGGAVEQADGSWPFADMTTPMIAALDSRTGQAIYTAQGEAGGIQSEIRWVRIALGGRIVAGLGEGVLSADPLAGELAWLNDEGSIRASLDAWIVGDRVLVLGENRDLWSVELESGRVDPAPLPTRSTTYARSAVEVRPLDGGLVVSSSRGVVVLDEHDAVVGADAIPAQDTLLPAVAGSQSLVTIDTAATPGGREYPLFALDFTGRLRAKPLGIVLNQAVGPEAIGLLAGRIVLSSDAGIILVPAPEAISP